MARLSQIQYTISKKKAKILFVYFGQNNSPRQNLKSHKSEPRFGQPRGAPARAERRGFVRGKSMGGTSCRPLIDFKKVV
ncbi:MAG: hypothetical protein A2915_04355 [Candidatus Yanofskybacteria bacterium RIFCSPLOWO2_01_FULL_41_34]|uniref:Uncharacterized protein n=1 Tax=Candidatus Yanofskybacteria bacterium RIFCSPHIGHO2_01_FULL_41_26 TaxID=1802661 RepID=A0A1F8EEA9_9BACT|nr:MAG: hypothetical protein A2649_03455 [Candidatus Yanofskybacteria bacterium RIFCSPHIGHO2_01_FULL_41_26]OGN21635.1 MAG: hypothetical protein A2915_04355 [Candidatus Yanofskybacteria bacterium RIFCSPLOWO2_01_FULL_41_34]